MVRSDCASCTDSGSVAARGGTKCSGAGGAPGTQRAGCATYMGRSDVRLCGGAAVDGKVQIHYGKDEK